MVAQQGPRHCLKVECCGLEGERFSALKLAFFMEWSSRAYCNTFAGVIKKHECGFGVQRYSLSGRKRLEEPF